MNQNKSNSEKWENIRNYSVFIGLTFIIVFYLRDGGKNISMGILLSILPFSVGLYAAYLIKKNKG